MNNSNPTFTVCICTRNRLKYLGAAVEAVLAQECPQGAFEILVVDNGSSDGTAEMVATRFGTATTVPVRYIYEANAGLSRARNRAIAETTSEFILFLDDDALPDPGWLYYLAAACTSSSDVAVTGGRVIPVYESGRPPWLQPHQEGIFGTRLSGTERRRVYYPEYPYGGNMIYRRSVFQAAGFFREDLGYRASGLIPAEETELLMRLEKSGGVILYEPQAIIRHFIPPGRASKKHMRRRFMAGGAGRYEVEKTRRNDFEDLGFREVGARFKHSLCKYLNTRGKILAARRMGGFDGFDQELRHLERLGWYRAQLRDALSQFKKRIGFG